MAFPFSRMLMNKQCMKLATVATRNSPSYISRTGGYRHCHDEPCNKVIKVIESGLFTQRHQEFTPQAWEAIQNAKLIATELEKKYVQPEYVIFSLLNQEDSGIAKAALVKARCEVDLLEKKILQIMYKEPKITEVTYREAARLCVTEIYHRFLSKIGIYHPPPEYSFLNTVNAPICCLERFLYEAYHQKEIMGDKVVGEEHLLIAYSDGRFGEHVFRELDLRAISIKHAARAIRRSDLKIKDHVKEDQE